MGAAEVAQRAAAQLQGSSEHLAQRGQQTGATRLGEPASGQGGVDAGQEERFAGVDVAGADDGVSGQQRLLHRHAPAAPGGMQGIAAELGIERLSTKADEQFARRVLVERGRPDHGAKAPRVVQTQAATRGVQCEVVVHPEWDPGLVQRQRSAHAQVQQQAASIRQRQPDVLAAPLGQSQLGADQRGGLDTQGPAQGLA